MKAVFNGMHAARIHGRKLKTGKSEMLVPKLIHGLFHLYIERGCRFVFLKHFLFFILKI